MRIFQRHFWAGLFLLVATAGSSQQAKKPVDLIEQAFNNPPNSAKPWVIWYWLHGAVSKEGIRADLEAMKKVGIGGAYLMTIRDTSSAIPFQPQVRQLTPQWWVMINYALQEAKRLKLEIGVHVSDGFALAGGPWIKPGMSMQKLVWTKTFIRQGNAKAIILAQPETKENYYRDIAVYAYPANYWNEIGGRNLKPVVTTSNGADASFLADTAARQTFRSDSSCWIQYTYPRSVHIRQVKIKKQNNAYQSQRFIIQKSDDGIIFTSVDTLDPPRHGWQDWDEPYTHAVRTFTAKYIRFVWEKDGTEPGSEDLDAAKWRPVLRLQGIYPGDEPVINNYEAKNGSVWRVANNTTDEEVSKDDAVPLSQVLNLTNKLSADGKLNWTPGPGMDWVIVRIGHTSTGMMNTTAGGGKGLECDKFSSEAAALQFNNWFGKFYTETDPGLAKQVIRVFHMDSWECGSQNWSENFAAEFKKKRGYDLLPWLLVMTGTPLHDAAASEKVLHDVRTTIAELVNDKFYLTLKYLASAKGCIFSAESIAPTFVSDGLMHYKHADMPMGEFWLHSPTHDKPNDMLDAISGAHIYGKNIVGAEAFTTLRSDFGEHPGNLKALGDLAFANGINKLALHVFMQNPWLDKKPGMTLDGIGLFYQRDQTWFKQSRAWIEYLTRCQAVLQHGKPVVDIAVFAGEEIPRRSVLPDRLISILPGLFSPEKVAAEKKRIENTGQPMRTIPDGVMHSANMADPQLFVDALNGYKYDCFNPDVLMQMKVVNGRVVTPGGASYAVLVIPGKHPMNPNTALSDPVLKKFKQLADAGARIIADGEYLKQSGNSKTVCRSPYIDNSLEKLGVKRDVLIENNNGEIAWSHRRSPGTDIYFFSNQTEQYISKTISLNNAGDFFEKWYAVSGEKEFNLLNGPFSQMVNFRPNESFFIIFRKTKFYRPPFQSDHFEKAGWKGNWRIKFSGNASPAFREADPANLMSWTNDEDPAIKYYAGTATYSNSFTITNKGLITGLILDSLCDMARVRVNGIDCGTLWTRPYFLEISKAVHVGENSIEIEVTNTWRNKLIFDELNPSQRKTWFNSPYKLKDKPLLPAGIIGAISIVIY